jgi:hypothetical protein
MHPTAALEFCEVHFLVIFILLGKDSTWWSKGLCQISIALVYRVIHKSLHDFRTLRYSIWDGHAEREHINM